METEATKKWVRITHTDNIPVRQGRAVTVGDREIAIFNLGDRFVAIDNRCPHQGGPLCDGIISGTTVVCPLHAWKIDLTSGMVRQPADSGRCIETFQTLVEDGVILLGLPAGTGHNCSPRREFQFPDAPR